MSPHPSAATLPLRQGRLTKERRHPPLLPRPTEVAPPGAARHFRKRLEQSSSSLALRSVSIHCTRERRTPQAAEKPYTAFGSANPSVPHSDATPWRVHQSPKPSSLVRSVLKR